MHGNSGYLFRFNPALAHLGGESFEIIERLTSAPSRRRGDDDMFSYGYLGLAFFPDGRTLGYLTGGATGAAVTALNKGASKGDEELHLVTYNVATKVRVDFIYRHIVCESFLTQFDSLPLSYIFII